MNVRVNKGMKIVYIYVRISRDEDKKNYGSIETQIAILEEYAYLSFQQAT